MRKLVDTCMVLLAVVVIFIGVFTVADGLGGGVVLATILLVALMAWFDDVSKRNK